MLDHPYAEFLSRVERPGRYLGGEFGAVVPPDTADLRIALAFPDAYEIGMSHIGLSVLYELVNDIEGLSAERVFMPWTDMEAELRARELPLLSLESARPLCEFDVVGFSLQYELTYTNLLVMLDLGRVPRRSADRGDGDPLVLVGGPLAVQCEPLAPFVDLALVGDGEQALPELLAILRRARSEGLARAETVDRARRHPAVMAPGSLTRERDQGSGRVVIAAADRPAAVRAVADHLGRYPTGQGPVPAVSAVFDRYSVEIARGCAEGCRFCQAGFLYRPVRERALEQVSAAAEQATADLGYDEISLAALSSADHSVIGPLISELGDRLTPRRVSLSVPSLRAYGLPDELVEVLGRLRATGVTLAPEAGSQRLRDVVNKNVTEQDLKGAAQRFFDHGFRRIKLYFMLGLPGETDGDLEEIGRLARELRDLGRTRMGGRTPEIVVSVSTFVPKPFTPFEREEMIGIDEIRRRQRVVESAAAGKGIVVRTHDPRQSQVEGIFSRGDADLAAVLERAADRGARFDGWGDMFDEAAWEGALAGQEVDRWLRAIPDPAHRPWGHVDVGVDDDFLRAERERAQQAIATAPCGLFARDSGAEPELRCHSCGVGCAAEDLPLRRERRADPAPPVGPVGKARSRSPKAAPDSELAGDDRAERVRLTVAKWGRQAFVGHLDTVRHVVHSLRRAGLGLRYTRGYHPKPKLTGGPALPLGTIGLAEPFDLWLIDPPAEQEIVERLRAAAPFDMEFTAAQLLPAGAPKLSKAINAAEYAVLARCSPARAAEAIERLLAADRFEVERVRKRKTSLVDLRPQVREAAVLDRCPAGLRVPEAPDRVPIRLVLAVSPSGGVRPAELLKPLLGSPELDAWIVRTRLHGV
jgi:radical SAM family uncharacterized protein/radical SAM-linked protein